MGTHPIFESDFDCLTEKMAMLSRLARPQLTANSKRFGGFSYFMARHPKQLHHLQFPKEAGALLAGLGAALALGYGFSAVFGNAEGPYHYDPEQFTPEEWETKSFALDRFLFKYVFPATSVSHWQTVACYKFQDEMMNKNRLIMDVRRISSQIGAMGTWQGAMSPQKNAGGYHDLKNTVHAVSPQLLNEMIQYADENDIKRSRDMVIRKVITENGEDAWRHGDVVENPRPGHRPLAPSQTRVLCGSTERRRVIS